MVELSTVVNAAQINTLQRAPQPLSIGTYGAASDWLRIAELVAQYADLPFCAVDASVIAAAERLGTNDIATLDHRHFTVVRSNIGTLNLVP